MMPRVAIRGISNILSTASDYDGGTDEEARGSNVGHVTTAACSDKCQPQPPTYHYERVHEEACPNHVCPIKHKLKDCDMTKNFMISRSLTQRMELDEDPDRSDMMSFLGEDAVMMIHDGHPPPHQEGAACLT
jgi:hypothetical protein